MASMHTMLTHQTACRILEFYCIHFFITLKEFEVGLAGKLGYYVDVMMDKMGA